MIAEAARALAIAAAIIVALGGRRTSGPVSPVRVAALIVATLVVVASRTAWYPAGLVVVNALAAISLHSWSRRPTAETTPEVELGEPGPIRQHRGHTAALVVLSVVAIAAWSVGVARQWSVNDDSSTSDQSKYLVDSHMLAGPTQVVIQDRAIMPLYPWILSAFDAPERSLDELFSIGKGITVAIAAAGTALLAWWSRRRFGAVAMVAGVAPLAYGVLMFKSPYAGADVALYFGVAVCGWLLVRLLGRPTLLRAGAAGVTLGLTHLAKAGVTPLLLCFFVAVGAVVVLPSRVSGIPAGRRMRLVSATVAVMVTGAAVVLPYSANSRRVYGSAMYNVNSTYYLWYDTWEDADRGTIRAGDMYGPPDLPADQIPSFSRYRSTHSVVDMADRVRGGAWIMVRDMFKSYGYADLMITLFTLAAVAVVSERAHAASLLRRRRIEFGFLALTAALYLCAWSWWMPFSSGNRFVLSIAIPAFIGTVWVIQRAWHRREIEIAGRTWSLDTCVLGLFIAEVTVAVPFLVWNAGHIYGGS